MPAFLAPFHQSFFQHRKIARQAVNTVAVKGIWVPIVTPFFHGRLDLDAAQRLATDLVNDGIHGLIVCGTTGEAAALDDREQGALLCAVIEAVGARCPVFMGVSGSNTRQIAEKITWLDQCEPDGYLISPPSYVRPSQEGIRQHFLKIASQTELPVVLYNIPARTGVNMTPETIASLADDPQFVAIKESSGDREQLSDIIASRALNVLSGDDAMLLRTLDLGGHGAISAAAHLRPDLYVRIYELMQIGMTGRASTLFGALLPMIHLLFSEPNPAPLKAVLSMQGRMSEEMRLPMLPMSAEGKKKLAQAFERIMLFDA